jgi:type I restriction enzyme M protein
MADPVLHCPIRGQLTATAYAKDKLTFSEEKRRIDCIRFLLSKGYPQANFKIETTLLRFGNKGRNSFRTDIAILDGPASSLPKSIDELKPHIVLVAEIKRDNKGASVAKHTQVKPALDFLHDISARAVYWDDVEQRMFYKTLKGTKTVTHETSIALLPKWGQSLEKPVLTVESLRTSANIRAAFEKIEDRLHAGVPDKSRRFELMLQFLLVKLYDEKAHTKATQEMWIQDYSDSPLNDAAVRKQFDDTLEKAVSYYGKYLPKEVRKTFGISGALLRSISSVLAPIKVLGSKRAVIQDFYMYFAQGVYKWDLAQYFTPTEVVDFVVSLVNPQTGDQVSDPACGSGDFLISAFHYVDESGGDIKDAVFGADNSDNAVQICVLNMVLNNDGKSNVKLVDSLATVEKKEDSYTVTLCNPPFGVKIVERRFEVLSKFDLGHEWKLVAGKAEKTSNVLASQQVGLLFAELCVRQAQAGGRIGIILPNGYLGNRSRHYTALREWLLRHTKLVAVVAFPRFTFKKSGADVSASVVVLEKRKKPLKRAADSSDYRFYAGLIESVGWNLSANRAEQTFMRDPASGANITNENNELVLDADFDRVQGDLWRSDVARGFPWLLAGTTRPKPDGKGWSVSIRGPLDRADLSLDPKRWCERATTVREQIRELQHFSIGDVAEIVAEVGAVPNKSALYRYVELEDVADGVISPTERRGWELPQRARHVAESGDVFVGRIWSSVSRWFVAGGDLSHIRVSNGFHRLRLRPGKSEFLIDLVAGLNSEAYRIQARAGATGSDGLAELSDVDLSEIVLPRLLDKSARKTVREIADRLIAGRSTVQSVINVLQSEDKLPVVHLVPRRTSWVQV